jgi:hypothetical protein
MDKSNRLVAKMGDGRLRRYLERIREMGVAENEIWWLGRLVANLRIDG